MDGDNVSHSSELSGLWKSDANEPASPGTPTQPASNTPPVVSPSFSPQTPFVANESGSPQSEDIKPITWSASEFIAHEKSAMWYVTLGTIAVAVAAIIFVITGGDGISAGVILFVAVVLGFAATRKPRTLPYKLDGDGLTINEKFYDYGQFRSFAVVDDGAFSSIVFMPLKRFMPLLEIYYEPKYEEEIINLLSERLPIETHKLDPVDKLMRHIRF